MCKQLKIVGVMLSFMGMFMSPTCVFAVQTSNVRSTQQLDVCKGTVHGTILTH